MAHISGVTVSGNRDVLIDYMWHATTDGTQLLIEVSHDTSAGLTKADQLNILEAVSSSVRHLS